MLKQKRHTDDFQARVCAFALGSYNEEAKESSEPSRDSVGVEEFGVFITSVVEVGKSDVGSDERGDGG